MEYYAGLDVWLRSCAICVVDGKGTVLHERDLPCEIEKIARYLTALPVSIERIGFECGTLSQHLFYGLKAKGFEVVCMEAREVSAALSAMRNKTDRNDARGIAQILRTGWFSPVHMKSREAHGVRALLSTRKALLSKTIDLANEVRGLLKIFGIRLPKTVKHGSFDDVVRPMIEMDEVLAHAMLALLDARLGHAANGSFIRETFALNVSGGYAALEISLTAGNSTEEDHRCDWQDDLTQSLRGWL
ncbi:MULTISPECIES: transposase [unclassified Sulfitobacter]|uniref:IS110 family transposase n=1 Tax=unclassified Sulfitobacter TaxID=196795 RepID=UPI0037465BCB